MTQGSNEERERRYAEVLEKHWPVADGNLGYYRTEVTCACGDTYWGGEHEGDPSLSAARAAHEARAVMAVADDELADLRAENEALHRVLDNLRVEVSTDIGEPSRCRVWKGGALVFDGVSTAATIPVAPTVVKG